MSDTNENQQAAESGLPSMTCSPSSRVYLLECALRDIEIWAEHDPAYFADRSEAMARIASKAKYALENEKGDSQP